jgi:tankyrase
MKHPRFSSLGSDYPIHLEKSYDRILTRIDQLWDTPEVHDYLSDLVIDKRGGRKGFPKQVLNDILMLREFRELETFRATEKKEDAIQELARRGIKLTKEHFFLVLHDGDKEVIDLFVRSEFNTHVTDVDGTQPLMFALNHGYTVVAKILLQAGADIDARDARGLTPLLIACGKITYGYKDIAEALIKKGALFNVRDSLGFTPLLLSLSGGSIEIAKLLIERGADVFARTRKGETALSLAKQSNDAVDAGIVELLISKGAKQ